MVDSADSSTRSLTPAGSVLPIGVLRSMRMSRCRPWCASSTDDGRAGVALVADELLRARPARLLLPSASVTTQLAGLDA